MCETSRNSWQQLETNMRLIQGEVRKVTPEKAIISKNDDSMNIIDIMKEEISSTPAKASTDKESDMTTGGSFKNNTYTRLSSKKKKRCTKMESNDEVFLELAAEPAKLTKPSFTGIQTTYTKPKLSDLSPRNLGHSHDDSGFVCSPEDNSRSDTDYPHINASTYTNCEPIYDIPFNEDTTSHTHPDLKTPQVLGTFQTRIQNFAHQKRLITLSISDDDELSSTTESLDATRSSTESSSDDACSCCSCSDSTISLTSTGVQTDPFEEPVSSPCRECYDSIGRRSHLMIAHALHYETLMQHSPEALMNIYPNSFHNPIYENHQTCSTNPTPYYTKPAFPQSQNTVCTQCNCTNAFGRPQSLALVGADYTTDGVLSQTQHDSYNISPYSPPANARFSFITPSETSANSTLNFSNSIAPASPQLQRRISRYSFNIDPLYQNQYTNEMAITGKAGKVSKKTIALELNNRNISQRTIQNNPYCSPMVARRLLPQQPSSLVRQTYGSLDDIKELQEQEEAGVRKGAKVFSLRNLSIKGKNLKTKWQSMKRVLSRGSSFRRPNNRN